jgi:aminoglycoside phosphotransferase (APT) family kinase protein
LAAWARWFCKDDRASVSDVRMPESGMANDTVMFRLDGEALVARLAPASGSAYPTFRTYDLGFQRRVIELVRARTKVPVPQILHLEDSDSWLDAPFMITRAVEGLVPSDNPPYLLDPSGWFRRGTPEDWKRFETSTIDVMIQLHKIEVNDDDMAFLSSGHPGKTALGQLLESMRSYYEWAREGHTVPILERALEVLAATLPANDRCVLNWGDARPGTSSIATSNLPPCSTGRWPAWVPLKSTLPGPPSSNASLRRWLSSTACLPYPPCFTGMR